jgi:alkyl hydroperoxide reductase subunit D
MSFELLKTQIPDYAKDLKLNLSSLVRETVLDDQKKWGTFLASAYAVGSPSVIPVFEAELADKLPAEAAKAAKAAAAIMGMNNIYYRFVHLASAKDYKTLPAKLRMNIIANPGVDKADFELWSLAVSAINGCGLCIDSHEAELRKHGVSAEQIQTAVRIAATVHAVAAILDAENTIST